MPIVHIQMLAGRPPERIRALITSVTEAVSRSLNVPADRIRVIVSEIPRTHWAVGGKPMAENAGSGKSKPMAEDRRGDSPKGPYELDDV